MTPKENVEAGQAKIGEESSLAEGSSLAETDGGEAKQIQEDSAEEEDVEVEYERRGLPYQDKFNEYEILMAQMSNDRRQRRTINFSDPSPEVRWQDLVPAFIPPS